MTCVNDAPVAVDDTATVGRGRRGHRGRRAGQRHRRRRRPDHHRLGHPAGQRHRGDHRRRHRPDLRAGRRTTATTRARHRAGHVHLHPQRRRHRHRQRDGDLCRRRPGGGRRLRDGHPERPGRPRSTCWPTTPTSTAARSTIASVTQTRPTAPWCSPVAPGEHTGLTYEPDAGLLRRPTRPRHLHLHADTGRVHRDGLGDRDLRRRRRPRSTTPRPWPRTTRPPTIDVLANDTDPDGGPISVAVGHPAGQRHRGDHQRRRRPDLRARPRTTATPRPAPRPTPSPTPYPRRLHRHGQRHGDLLDDDPVAVDDSATVPRTPAATAVDVLANDTDVDGGPKPIASATDPANGTVVLTGGTRRTRADLPARRRTTATPRRAPRPTPSPTPSTAAPPRRSA